MASLGITDTEDDPTVLIESATGGPRLWFQQVPEPKASKNRVHLDVRAVDRRHEVERLQALGAVVLNDQADGLTVMRDPEANEFCFIAETTHYGTDAAPENPTAGTVSPPTVMTRRSST